MSSTSGNISPEHTHLGKSWEIAIVTVFVILVLAIVAAMLFQARRKRRKRIQQGAVERDLEGGQVNNTKHEVLEESIPEQRKRMSEIEVTQPSAARVKDSNRPSTSYHEYISQKPPNYYWNQR